MPNPSKTPDAAPRSRILIVDDHLDRCRCLRTALSAAGFEVEAASDPDEVSARLRVARPNVILVDPQLSGSDGSAIARTLLVDPQFAGIPILALGAGSPQPDPATDLFDSYLSEGMDPAELVRQILALPALSPPPGKPEKAAPSELPPVGDLRAAAEEILDSVARGLPDSQFAPDTSASLHRLAAALTGSEAGGLPEYLERAEILAEFHTVRSARAFRSVVRFCRDVLGRDKDPSPEFEALRAEYLNNRSSELQALSRALWRGDFAVLATTGHNLKGTGAAYGFAELTELGRALEAAAKDRDSHRIEALLDESQFYLSLVRRPASGGKGGQ